MAIGLLFFAGVGSIFRTLFASVNAHVAVPGVVFAAAFLAYCIGLVFFLDASVLARPIPVHPRWIRLLLGLVALGLAVWPLVVPGSVDARADRDEALDYGVQGMVQGLDPWATTTQLGNHISPLLGGLILALPFAVVATASMQTALWFGAGAWLGDRFLGTRPAGVVLILLLLSPVVINEIAFESDIWILAIVIAICALAAVQTSRGGPLWIQVLAGAIMGLVVGDRFIFGALAVAIVMFLWRRRGVRSSLPWVGSCAASCVLLYGVMVLAYPASIASMAANVEKADQSIGASGPILAVAMLAVAATGGVMARSAAGLVWALCATALILPVWQSALLLLSGSATTFNDYSVVSYSSLFLVFGLLALVVSKRGLAD